MKLELAKYQLDAVKSIRYQKNCVDILAFYVGAGKSLIIIEKCRELIKKHKKIKIGIAAFLQLDTKEQMGDQCIEYLGKDTVCVVQSGVPLNKNANVFVFNPQSMYRKDEIKLDYLIVDEAHEGFSRNAIMLNSIVENSNITKILLVSATPWVLLNDSRFKDAQLLTRSIKDGIKDGRIAENTKLYFERFKIKIKNEDYFEGELKEEFLKLKRKKLRRLINTKADTIIKNKELGNKAMFIVPAGKIDNESCWFARQLYGHLCAKHGANCVELNISDSDEESTVIIERFKKDKRKRFMVVVRKARVGFNMPELTDVIDLSLTRNYMSLVQSFGRVVRKCGDLNKRYYYVFDETRTCRQIDVMRKMMIYLLNCDYSLISNKRKARIETKQTKGLAENSQFTLEDEIKRVEIEKNSAKSEEYTHIDLNGNEDKMAKYMSYEEFKIWYQKNWYKLKKTLSKDELYKLEEGLLSRYGEIWKNWYKLGLLPKNVPIDYRMYHNQAYNN